MKQIKTKLIIGLCVGMIILLALYYVGFSDYFSLESIKSHAIYLKSLVDRHYVSTIIIFLSISTALIACALPVTGPVAVTAGFLFGLWQGVLYTMIAATVGTLISFFVVRYAMAHILQRQYGARLDNFKAQLHSYGYTYLISLQLLTVVPYFVINTLAALAGVPFTAFIWTTIIGSLPIIVIYTFAGQQLYMIRSWQDIVSFNMLLLLLMLAALAFLPVVIKKVRGISAD